MFKTISGSKLADRSKGLFSQLDLLARESQLISRSSAKFSAKGFVLSLFKAVLTGKASFNQIAANLKRSEKKSMSRQGVHGRMDQAAVSFMMAATGQALKERWAEQSLICSKVFNRVLVEDSCQAKTHLKNAEDFPGHGNGKGKTAGCKSDLAFDLLTGEPVFQSLHLATEQDRELGKDLVDLVEADDLVLRDMGYFSVKEFARIAQRSAYWLSRVPASVTICDSEGRKLETILRHSKAREIAFEARVTQAGHRARLLAVRAAPEVARQRRRMRRAKARELGKQPNKDMLLRDGWYLLITNIGEDLMDSSELFKLYATRWQIEITFRAWKQSGQLIKAIGRDRNLFHLQCLIYAAIIILILTMKTASLLRQQHARYPLSIEKLAHDLGSQILTLVSLDHFGDYDPDPRHLQMDKRSRKSLFQIATECLT
jgi:hypothetical protein